MRVDDMKRILLHSSLGYCPFSQAVIEQMNTEFFLVAGVHSPQSSSPGMILETC